MSEPPTNPPDDADGWYTCFSCGEESDNESDPCVVCGSEDWFWIDAAEAAREDKADRDLDEEKGR